MTFSALFSFFCENLKRGKLGNVDLWEGKIKKGNKWCDNLDNILIQRFYNICVYICIMFVPFGNLLSHCEQLTI